MFVKDSNGLDRLFYPQNIAMVGASPKREMKWSNGNAYISGCIRHSFPGNIYPVHPSGESILGYKTYKRIRDIPVDLDLVIFTIPSRAALQVMEECSEKGVKFVHLLTAGFSETGREEHAEMEKKLVSIAEKGGTRIVGPNCMGLYCPEGGISWSTEYPTTSGPIGFFSQSGQLASDFVHSSALRGLRFSKVASFGNASDLQAHDFLEYLVQDEKTKIIGSYLEGLKDGRAFFNVARTITREKPLVIWKGGLTEGGFRATRSHTAAIAGSPEIWRALCRQAGIISVDSMEEMIYTVAALNRLSLSDRLKNVAILGGAGGGSVTMTDTAEKEGLKVPHLAEETIRRIEEFVPLQGNSPKNPLDVESVFFSRDHFMRLITLLRDDPNIDILIFSLPIHWIYRDMGRVAFNEFIQNTVEVKNCFEKPVFSVLEKGEEAELETVRREVEEIYRNNDIPTFPTFQLAARVINNLDQYRDFLSAQK